MKAAVLHNYGTNPKYQEFTTPIPQNENETILSVKASSLKQLDKLKASGKHYTSYPELPTTVGIDGAGILDDGTRVYSWGKTGMFAEKAIVERNKCTVIPDGVDFEIAAALPNALLGSDAALLYRGNIQPGNTVLINGSTGVTGKIAVQMAKNRGADYIIATGRNETILQELQSLGADITISLSQPAEDIISQISTLHKNHKIDIVLDYLWGTPAELVLKALKTFPSHKVKFVSVGEMANQTINLPSGILRSSQIELLGSGIGSIAQQDIDNYLQNVLPSVYKLHAEGKLVIDIETAYLKDIESIWDTKENPGKRLVIKI